MRAYDGQNKEGKSVYNHSGYCNMSTKMNRLIKLRKAKRLSEFSVQEIVTSFGMYESAIIYLRDVKCVKSNESEDLSSDEQPHIYVSPDVAVLNTLLTGNSKYMFPCPSCLREQPLSPKRWGNPRNMEYRGVPTNASSNQTNTIRIIRNQNKNIFEVSDPLYRIGEELLCDITDNDVAIFQRDGSWDSFLDKCVCNCRNIILKAASEIRRDYVCGYDVSHQLFVNFRIYDPIEPEDIILYSELLDDREKYQELIEAFEYLRDCLIIQKVGQYPSLADLQMFEVGKYRKILGKDSYRDLTRAIGLRADGIGAGAFLYLRRILEHLVEEKHHSLINSDGWDEQAYKDAKFDDRIKILEKFGVIIFPDDLKRVKSKIYGILSKGVHESSDDECNELFPYVEYSIEQILDEQIKQIEHDEKIKRLNVEFS